MLCRCIYTYIRRSEKSKRIWKPKDYWGVYYIGLVCGYIVIIYLCYFGPPCLTFWVRGCPRRFSLLTSHAAVWMLTSSSLRKEMMKLHRLGMSPLGGGNLAPLRDPQIL